MIVIIHGDLPNQNEMPEGIYEYIRTNTYLKWDDPWFWQKLRYVLPHNNVQTWCCTRLFNRKHQRKQDQLHLIQAGNLSVNSRHVSMSDISSNGLTNVINCRGNSVSPI